MNNNHNIGGLSSYGLLLMVACFLRSQPPTTHMRQPTDDDAITNSNSPVIESVARRDRHHGHTGRLRSSSMDSGSCVCAVLGYGANFHGAECARSRRSSSSRLGYLLFGFFHKFGNLNASLTGISLSTALFDRRSGRDPNQFDPLYIEDPLQPENNVGRNCFRIAIIQKQFLEAANTLERYQSTVKATSAALGGTKRGMNDGGRVCAGANSHHGYLASIIYCLSASDPTCSILLNPCGEIGHSGDETESIGLDSQGMRHSRGSHGNGNQGKSNGGVFAMTKSNAGAGHQRNYRDALTSSLGTGHALLLAHMNVHEQVRASPVHWQHASVSASTSPPYGQGRSVTGGSADFTRHRQRIGGTPINRTSVVAVGETAASQIEKVARRPKKALRRDGRSMSMLL
jgi:hypothetical protein